MIENEDKLYRIYEFLDSDPFFQPGTDVNDNPEKCIKLFDENGNEHLFSKSYYATLENGESILIRVSNHATVLDYWINFGGTPEKSLQNVCILITDEIFHFTNQISKSVIEDENGNKRRGYLYFVVEQYRYNADKISFSDFKKIIKRLKNSPNSTHGVFTDPLKKDPSKRAYREILIPTDDRGRQIPRPSIESNLVNPRQLAVAEYEDDSSVEVDKNGNVINEMESFDLNAADEYDMMVQLNDAYNGNTETFDVMQDFLDVFFSFQRGDLSNIDLDI